MNIEIIKKFTVGTTIVWSLLFLYLTFIVLYDTLGVSKSPTIDIVKSVDILNGWPVIGPVKP